jgi:hypothetical protein
MIAGLIEKVRNGVLLREAKSASGGEKLPVSGTQSPAVSFDVVGGLHKGARLDLTESTYTIGSDTAADIVLRDSGIADLHARLRYRSGRVELEAIGGAVDLANGEAVPEGRGRRCRLPLDLKVGGAQIRLEDSRPAKRGLVFTDRPLLVLVSIVAVVFVLSIATKGLSRAAPEPWTQQAAASQSVITTSIPASANTTPAGKGTLAERAREQLDTHLAESGLDSLTVDNDEGRLVVSGTIPSGRHDAWRNIQAWFDQAYGGQVLLASKVKTGVTDQKPRLALRAIWYGQRPYIITADGARYHEGAFLNDGWIIEEIGNDRLLLARNGTTVALKYR